MSEDMSTALDIYHGWQTDHDLLIQAITPLTPEQLALRPAPHLRSIGDIARHIIGARARWCRMVLDLGDDDLAVLGQWDRPDMPERTAAELVEGLRASWAVLRAALAGWSVADLAHAIPNNDPDPGEPAAFTRQWVLWHLIEHDLHHGGEISLILGSNGLTGLDI